MGLGWLLVPALGGYWLLTHLRITRYSVLRDSGYHVFFRAATAGGLLVVVAYALVQCTDWAFPAVGLLWKRVVPFDYSGTFMLSAVLGFVLPSVINLFYRDVMVAERAAVETGDLIELLIAESIRRHILIEVSLKSGKAYIGYAIEAEPPVRGESDVAVVPLWSGYRHSETRELTITKDYVPVISQYFNQSTDPQRLPARAWRWQDFRVAIPRSEIGSARLFDPEVYDQLR